ncbi:MAG: nucleotidyltransferase substrate binding protein [Brevinematales bacterium]|nr:nucleotidyltransferase substrate binding protein [Brevinematales bacterium]
MKDILLKYKSYLSECSKHLSILKNNFEKISNYLPINQDKINELYNNEETLSILDQIAYRYIKIQDTIGKLIRVYLFLKGEDINEKAMIDIINIGEKIGIPIDEELWLKMRVIRNMITHEYPESLQDIAKSINEVHKLLPKFIKLFEFLSK